MSPLDARARLQPKAASAPAKSAPEPSLRERAYAEIKRRINCLEYQPGAYINEAQVSRQLRIGRTPVHQALDRLMHEGLVEVIPRKGVIVQSISLEQILQIVELRLVNEPYCVALAAERATGADIAALERLLAQAPPLIRARDREGLMGLDRAFHHALAQAARNPVLTDLLAWLHERSLRFWFISLGDDLQLRRVDEEHHAVLEAVAARERERAVAAMRTHIESFRKNIMRTI